jgi:hypothetical protein
MVLSERHDHVLSILASDTGGLCSNFSPETAYPERILMAFRGPSKNMEQE